MRVAGNGVRRAGMRERGAKERVRGEEGAAR